ncbi:Sodium Bile acid symporter family [Oleispira antarctica RB-8]|uniref:Sodium Bile acid symporter family n=1 Tax=Oleispira antarctica RB-8 TaxID=698738 RepID=R4YL32_OLEAN|nr:Sodium Bile acid symporter family [Oleispira antarctica RB-8]
MEFLQILTQLVLPISLALMMFSLGLSLSANDFRRIAVSPRPAIVGIVMQLLLLPLIAWILLIAVQWFMPISNELILGLIILAACPGGATSNIISHLSGGDGALSVSMTAVVSLLMPFILPLSLALQLAWWDETLSVDFPVMKTVMQLLLITVIPVLLGMLTRGRWLVVVLRLEPTVRKLTALMFVLLVLFLMLEQWPQLNVLGFEVAALCLSLCLCSMFAAYLFARCLSFDNKVIKTLSIEVGVQNAGMGIFIAIGVLNQPILALVPLMYGLVMNIPAFSLIAINLYRKRSQS